MLGFDRSHWHNRAMLLSDLRPGHARDFIGGRRLSRPCRYDSGRKKPATRTCSKPPLLCRPSRQNITTSSPSAPQIRRCARRRLVNFKPPSPPFLSPVRLRPSTAFDKPLFGRLRGGLGLYFRTFVEPSKKLTPQQAVERESAGAANPYLGPSSSSSSNSSNENSSDSSSSPGFGYRSLEGQDKNFKSL